MDILKQLSGAILSKLTDGIVFIVNINNDSINFIAKSNESLKDKINIGLLIKDVAKIAEGSGGGSLNFAQGGGTNVDKLDMILTYVKSKIVEE